MRKLIICFLACLSTLYAQDKYLSLEATTAIIRSYHPVVRQAKLEVAQMDAALQAARGLFDPSFYHVLEQKTFNGTDYFNYSSQTLKIPTWFGMDIKAGLANNSGLRTDPSLTAGKSTYVGVSIPVLKGLLFDKRRAAVQQGKLFVRMSQQDQRLVINELLLDANMAYWKWAAAHRVESVLSKALAVSESRYTWVYKAWLSGDRAAIDTVEAMAQLQAVQVMKSQAEYELQKTRLQLDNFLWTPDGKPYDLPDDVLPDTSWLTVPVKNVPIPGLEDMLKLAF
jgi:outer membrane protein TolC